MPLTIRSDGRGLAWNMDGMDTLKVDRAAFTVGSLHDGTEEAAFWQARSPQERLAAMELMRRIVYGDAQCSGRLQRVLEVA